jgi:hypothetical protein
MREKVLYANFHRGELARDWFLYANELLASWTACVCWACNSSARTATFGLGLDGAVPRRILVCPRCGFVEDVAVNVKLRFELDHRDMEMRLIGRLPSRGWSAVIQFDSPNRALSRSWKWPAGVGGSPLRSWRTPEVWPLGPLKVSFNFVHNGSINCISNAIYSGSL